MIKGKTSEMAALMQGEYRTKIVTIIGHSLPADAIPPGPKIATINPFNQLLIYTPHLWKDMEKRIGRMDMSEPDNLILARLLLGFATDIHVAPGKLIAIPELLLMSALIEDVAEMLSGAERWCLYNPANRRRPSYVNTSHR